MAVPSAVAQFSAEGNRVGNERLTLRTAYVLQQLPSVTFTSLMLRLGGPSSLTIVTTPCALAMVALLALLRFTTKFSSSSLTRSPLTLLVSVCVVTPAAKVSVPLAGA